jgi:hypothetical protein
MKKALIIGLLFIVVSNSVSAQDPVPPDTLQIEPVEFDSTAVRLNVTSDSLQSDSKPADKRPDFAIYPVKMPRIPGVSVILTDSTIRWRQWLEYQEYLVDRPGTIPFRLGAMGRTDLLVQSGLLGSQFEFRLEGMDWRNPVSGHSRMGDIPMERLGVVSEREQGGRIIHEAELFSIYSPKPITRVSYIQTAYELRNTDARVSRMINHNSGFDLIYQGKNNASEFRRMGTESRQAGVRYFRHLNEKWYGQALVLYTGSEHEESDGYQLPSLVDFNFSRFFANPTRQTAQSRLRSTQAMISLSRVVSDSELKLNQTQTRFIAYYDRFKRGFTDTDIDFGYDVHQVHAGAEHSQTLGFVSLHGSAKAYTSFTGGLTDLSINNWSGYRAEANATIDLIPGVTFPAGVRLDGRSDGHQTIGLDAGVVWSPLNLISISGNYALGSQMPEIGTKYATKYVSSADELQSTNYQRMRVGLRIGSESSGLMAHFEGNLTSYNNYTVLSPDRQYFQNDGVEFLSASAGMSWNHPNWEVATVGVLLDQNASGSTETTLMNVSSLHWKGYVLSNASYIRAGITGTTSFLSMKTPQFHAVIDNWGFQTSYDAIPAYSRVDLDLSARVRSLIFMFKYENVLQNVGQAGYYETAPYPMPSRRFRFGLRVVFIN